MKYIDQFKDIEVVMNKGDKLPTIYVDKAVAPIYLNKKDGTKKRYFVIDAINVKTNKKNQVLVHKLVAETLVKKEDENDNRIIFLDGDRHNYHPDNLKWTTASKEMKAINVTRKKKAEEKEKIIKETKDNLDKSKKENELNRKIIDDLNRDKKDYKKAVIGVSIALIIGVCYFIYKFM